MKKNMKIKWLMFVLTSIMSVSLAAAQTAAPAAPAATSVSIPINTVLCTIAVVLLLIIMVLAMTVNSAIDLYKNKKADTSSVAKNITLFIGFLLLSSMSFAQDPTATSADSASAQMAKIYFYSFITLIIIEVIAILFLLKSLRFLTGIEQLKTDKMLAGKESTFWEKMNKMKPIEEEASLDTGHSYDGIRELDNITPPWFTYSFLASIVIAMIYLYQNHISHSMPTQEEEFEVEMREAKVLQDSLLKLQGNNIDESNVKMLAAAEIASGQKLYMSNCSACHGDKGQGGVGPNLTDDYWLHGGAIGDVFKSIKYGIVEKGMKSWKDDFSANQIAQLASYIKSIKGTNPAGAKEKQGELYKEVTEEPASADAQTK